MEQWSAIAPQLYVWNYVANFGNFLLPHPNMSVFGQDIRFFVKNKTLGLFEQGDAYSTTGDFIRLRAWVLAHLMWDPSRDQQALIREFMEGYYGPAAPHLLEYLDLLHNTVEKSGVRLRCFSSDTSAWLTLAVLNEATVLFDRAAEAVAGNPALTERVRRERLPLDHVWLKRHDALRREAKRSGVEFRGPADPMLACQEWIDANHHFGNRFYGEQRPFEQYAKNLARQFRPPAPAPDICKGLSQDDWLDVQDNRFRLHSLGKWSNWVDDENASDKAAASMPGSHPQWAIQYQVPDHLADDSPWHAYVFVRCDAKRDKGRAMDIGLYDGTARKTVARRDVTIEESAGTKYQPIDLGTHALRSSMYFWVAPGTTRMRSKPSTWIASC